jgi:hypothetical protein
MQQRRPRPGDILDDYCPRERRITDHAVVAMIDDAIKQTRCVACDTEHEYKHARVPARKKKMPAGLFDQVLDGLQGSTVRLAAQPSGVSIDADDDPAEAGAEDLPLEAPALLAATPLEGPPDDGPFREHVPPSSLDEAPGGGPRDEIPFRRSLIRAQLPRTEGQTPTRALPEFTIRQPQNGRAGRPGGGRRRPGSGSTGFQGPMRSGRAAHGSGGGGHAQGQGRGRGQGPGPTGRPERGGHPQRGGRGRRGKKH